MTSFTRKLYNRDPAAAEAFRSAASIETKMHYGKAVTLACFTPSAHGLVPAFGKRLPSGHTGCARNCRHPACSHGCTLVARNGGSR
jgi:hypothetical protein